MTDIDKIKQFWTGDHTIHEAAKATGVNLNNTKQIITSLTKRGYFEKLPKVEFGKMNGDIPTTLHRWRLTGKKEKLKAKKANPIF